MKVKLKYQYLKIKFWKNVGNKSKLIMKSRRRKHEGNFVLKCLIMPDEIKLKQTHVAIGLSFLGVGPKPAQIDGMKDLLAC